MKNHKLCFQKITDDLSAIQTVGAIRDMHPIRAFAVVLPDELVEIAMRLDPFEPPLALRYVAVDTKISRLALHVLGVAHTANCIIQSQRPIAGTNLYRVPHRVAQRLQYLMHQGAQIDDVSLPRIVADAFCLCRVARAKLLDCKVLADLRRHSYMSSLFGSILLSISVRMVCSRASASKVVTR